jgi:ParG
MNDLLPIAVTPDHPDHWRRILTITYAHLSERKGVSRIKKEGTGIKRVNINLEVNLHHAFKAATSAQGVDMTTVLMQFIQTYVAKYQSSISRQSKSRRA